MRGEGEPVVGTTSRGRPVVMGPRGAGLTEALLVLGAVVAWLCAGAAALANALGS